MRIAEIDVPKGCEKIYVDQEANGIVITYASKINGGEFYCKETDEKEMTPNKGDFSIFWDDLYRENAIVACFDKMVGNLYKANDGFEYKHAIKFRNYEQYLAVRGIHE